MDRQQIGLKLTIDTLGLPFRLETFEDRLVLQKAVYLLQAASVHLGYNFRWYLRGPYSPSLTRDAFAITAQADGGPSELAGWNLDGPSREQVGRLKPLFAGDDRKALADKLELLASVHFLSQTRSGDQPPPAPELRDVLLKYGKNFSEAEIRKATEELATYGLSQPRTPRQARG